jgi:hypothetical protein
VDDIEENEDSPDSLPPEADVAGAMKEGEEGITVAGEGEWYLYDMVRMAEG